MAKQYRVLFAETPVKLAALIAADYADWTVFDAPLEFTRLEADRNFDLQPGDQDNLDIQGPGWFTVAFR